MLSGWLGLLASAGSFLLVFGVEAAPHLYDETIWTKREWQQLKLPFPLLPTAADAKVQDFRLLSNAGPYKEGHYDRDAKDR